MTWENLDWKILDRLRDGFLNGGAASGPYWRTTADLDHYDFTYAERIGWKWDAVLRELALKQWRPRSRTLFDWGCGSGVATRHVLSFFGAGQFDRVQLWDHSPLACDYAAGTVKRDFPAIATQALHSRTLDSDEPVGLLLISHVYNELDAPSRAALLRLIGRAESVIWVEAGTHAVARGLQQIRDELRAQFQVVAPCTHQNNCPILIPGNERDWCHFFAHPPSEIFASSHWVKFGQRAGIDLRSLPYAFIALDRATAPPADSVPAPLSRVIGRPEHFKPYARLLNCDATGLAMLTLPKRSAPALLKQLDRTKAPLVYHWQREGDKILGGHPLGAPPSATAE